MAAKKLPLKGDGVAGSAGTSVRGTYRDTKPGGGSSQGPLDGGSSISSDNEGRSSGTLRGSKVYRTRPNGNSGSKGGLDNGAGLGFPGKVENRERNQGSGSVYRSTKPKR